jgi:hypothetical protein
VIICVLANRQKKLQMFIKHVRVWEMHHKDKISSRRKAMAAKQCAHSSSCTDCGPGAQQAWSKKKKQAEENIDLCQNFRRLLWFWQQYYSHCNCDRYSLECSSGVKFNELQSVVEMLCADDGSPAALLQSKIALPRLPARGVNPVPPQ